MNLQSATLKKIMLEALGKNLGIVSAAAEAANISRQTHYDWLKTDAEYKAAVEDLDNLTLDFAENALIKKIDSGDTTAIIFFLKTKGKKRGYIERNTMELEINDETSMMNRESFLKKVEKAKVE